MSGTPTAQDPETAQSSEEGFPGRWQPTRAGILNVWRYYREVFTFHRGRLLLRGRNGTGKSKALELLLPFLLDASLRPNRLSTFGGNERAMHWNMIGHGYPGATRVGYVWLEFARSGAEGPEYMTLGARLQATRDVSSVRPTYFTARARVDEDVSLLTPEQQPLTVAQLKEALQDTGIGTVHSGPDEYRSVVRSSLYPQLDQARYDALITALLQLRTPKLSERLDPGLLSSLLSSALPPLGHGELADIAGGFERLDRHRVELQTLADEVEAAKSLADKQRVYAARVLRGAAAELTSATSTMERRRREEQEARSSAAAAEEELTRLSERAGELDTSVTTVSGELQGLKDSDAYRAGAGIELLRERVEGASAAETARATEAARRREGAEHRSAQARELSEEATRAGNRLQAAATTAARAAHSADLGGAFDQARAELDTEASGAVDRVRRLLRAAAQDRRSRIEEVRGAADTYRARVGRRDELEADLAALTEDLTDAEEHAQKAATALETQVDHLAEAVTEWARACVELPLEETETLVAHIDHEHGTGPHTVVAAARQRAGEALAALARDADRRAASVRAEHEEVAEELERASSTAEVAPPAPPTRSADRAGRPGAPLWKLVDFAPGVEPRVQAAVEAALEASGLLDAWLLPDGSVPEDGVVGDTVASATARPVAGPNLLEVLTVEEEAPVPAEHVRALLAGVAYTASGPARASSSVGVGADGRWWAGPMHGQWSKQEPAHVGALARERARERAVAALTARLRHLESALEEAGAEQDTVAERRRALAEEAARLPSDAEARRAAQEVRSAQERLADRHEGLRRQGRRLEEHAPLVTEAEQHLHTLAARLRLPADRAALAEARTGVEALEEAVEPWLDGQVEVFGLTERSAQARALAEGAEEEAARAADAASEAATEAEQLRARLSAMDATVGVEHRRVQERVSAAEQRLRSLRADLASLHTQQLDRERESGELRVTVRTLQEESAAAVQHRDSAAERFRGLLHTALCEDSGLQVQVPAEATVRGTLEAARAVSATSRRTDHTPELISAARGKVAEVAHSTRDVLARRTYLELITEDEIQQVSALLDGVRVGAQGLHRALVQEQRTREGDLTDEERALFDRVLTGDTRRHLADRLRRANGLVAQMNERLERVRTASGITVRLRWEVAPDAPRGTQAARDLLTLDPRRLTDQQREVLHTFFRERIDDARAQDSTSGWEEHLSRVLDYTDWHRFIVELDKGDGAGRQPLTKRAHGRLSGGEKAIALHLPLFAAVAAHYATDPHAPRFILLDEVFVGVDTTNRGQIFALLVDLGLDLVLTSDHEWGTYAELDGIAVHQLLPGEPGEGDDTITSARWVWTGTALEPDEGDR